MQCPYASEVEDVQDQFDPGFDGVLDIDLSIKSKFGVNLLSHEFRLIFQLLVNRHLIVKEAALSSQLSSRAFYELLKRMERDELIVFEQSNEDRRAKSIRLHDDFAAPLSRICAPLVRPGALKVVK